MCLILFAIESHPRFPLIVAANRDERYARPTRSLHWWADAPQVIAGRDLEAGGTWLGATRDGRFSAITNVREGAARKQWQRSRGELTRDFLLRDTPPAAYAAEAHARGDQYAGFNLLVGDCHGFHYCSNRGQPPRRLAPGIYGLSNDSLDSAWPKVTTGKQELAALLQATPSEEQLLQLLADTRQPDDAELPDTGIGAVLERILASRFIATETYGTRASTVLRVDHSGCADIVEQNFTSGGSPAECIRYDWRLERTLKGTLS